MTPIKAGDEDALQTYRWRGVNSHGDQHSGRMALHLASLPGYVEARFRNGWRSLAIHSGDGPVPPGGMADELTLVAAIEKHLDTGKRTWWSESAEVAKTFGGTD